MTSAHPLIAIVDDEEPVRTALRRLFLAAGRDVETFASGAAFLASLEHHAPDCLLLDLHMPELTGFDVQACLARRERSIPTVVITGHDQPETRSQVMAAGAAAYLLKPIDEETLFTAIATALSGGPAPGALSESLPIEPSKGT